MGDVEPSRSWYFPSRGVEEDGRAAEEKVSVFCGGGVERLIFNDKRVNLNSDSKCRTVEGDGRNQ